MTHIKILHLNTAVNYLIIYTGNTDIKVYFGLYYYSKYKRLLFNCKLLVFNTQTCTWIPFATVALDQLGHFND